MSVKAIIEKIEAQGIRLRPRGDKLRLEGNTQALTPEQLDWLKAHKPEILTELKAANQDTAHARLRELAPKYHLDPDELLDWYRHDLETITGMDDAALDALVRDYAANRPTFRGEQPYRPYTLWFYKIDRQHPGHLRQALMTDDPAQAQKQLTAIYGQPVHELHTVGEHQCS